MGEGIPKEFSPYIVNLDNCLCDTRVRLEKVQINGISCVKDVGIRFSRLEMQAAEHLRDGSDHLWFLVIMIIQKYTVLHFGDFLKYIMIDSNKGEIHLLPLLLTILINIIIPLNYVSINTWI